MGHTMAMYGRMRPVWQGRAGVAVMPRTINILPICGNVLTALALPVIVSWHKVKPHTERNGTMARKAKRIARKWEVFNIFTGRIVAQYRTERSAMLASARMGGHYDYDLAV